jgi:hypothetical protein
MAWHLFLADAPDLDRIILPGSPSSDTTALFERWAEQRQQPAVERIHQAGGYVYDVTFTDMARRAGSAVANQTVYLLEYPMGRVATDAPAYPLGLSVRVVVLALLGLGLCSTGGAPRVSSDGRPEECNRPVLRNDASIRLFHAAITLTYHPSRVMAVHPHPR